MILKKEKIKTIFTFLIVTILIFDCEQRSSTPKNQDLLFAALLFDYITPNGYNRMTSNELEDGSILILGGVSIKQRPSSSSFIFKESLNKSANMITPRHQHDSTFLKNGNIFISGGTTAFVFGIKDTEIYDFSRKVFVPGPDLKIGRYLHTTTRLNDGRVLIIGGSDTMGKWLNSSEIYDPVSNKISETGNLNIPRGRHKATLLASGEVLVTGGNTSAGGTSTVELFNPTLNTFSIAGSMQEEKIFHTATAFENKVIVTGGYKTDSANNLIYQSSIELFDRNSNSFTKIGSLEGSRHSHRDVKIDQSNLLVCGGVGGESNSPTFYKNCFNINITTNTVANSYSMLEARAYFTMNFIPQKRILICGGNTAKELTNTCEIINENGSSSYIKEILY